MFTDNYSTPTKDFSVPTISCTNCNAMLQEDDINHAMGAAQCSFCQTWIRLDDQETASESSLRSVPVDRIPVPEHIRIDRKTHELEIVVAPQAPFAKALGAGSLPFVIVPIVFLGVITFFIFTSPIPAPFAIAPIAMGLMALLAFRKIGKVMKNLGSDQVIKVEKRGNLYCQEPILGGEAKVIPSREVTQLYCTESLQRKSNSFQTNRRHYQLNVYNVNALQQDGTSSLVIGGITAKTDAILIERQIEEFLGLPPESVPGEID